MYIPPLALVLTLAALPATRDGSPCAAAAAATAVDAGWRAYRQGNLTDAARSFAISDSLCPAKADAQIGLGFVFLRQGDVDAARARFDRALRSDSNAVDGWYGAGLARLRANARAGAIAAFRRALAITPDYGEVVDQLLALGVDSGLALRPQPSTAEAAIPARTAGERFEVRTSRGWEPFYVKGVNVGAALPGRFPAEFPPADSTYAHWFALIAAANANAVRVYTIFPPAFYRALRSWNDAHPERPLWLVHGVWAEPPPLNDYDAAAWKMAFRSEMERVADVVHGRARIALRPGHAWGRYTADVSDHVLAFILGREWEPFSIRAYNARRKDLESYHGRFLTVAHGTPMDVWLAEQCDYMLGYEWQTYHAQRPIAYTNWPTLDPLHHPTEASAAEEQSLRIGHGFPRDVRLKEYDNDAVSLDAMLVETTPEDRAGYFAAYHAYPYYPDFMNLDPDYGAARSSFGPSHYFGYLQDLARHHAGRPLLIAEYGVPSSRGISHLQPEGMNHGGHDERAMAALDVRQTQEIHDAGLAGGIVFSWLDEWFKHTWVTVDLEQPAERTRLWHNVMNAEQNYGLLGEYAGDSATTPEPGGDPQRWRAFEAVAHDSALTLRVGVDPAYVYLALDGVADLDSSRYTIGISTYARAAGRTSLPGVRGSGPPGAGFEFALVLADTGNAQLLVVPWYNPFLVPRMGAGPTALDAFYNHAASVEGRGGTDWDSMFVTTNRWRIGRDGRTFPAHGVNRGRLRYGTAAASSLADWFVDRSARLAEIRLPWALLNVTDPSSHRILRRIGTTEVFQTLESDGLGLAVAISDRASGATRAWISTTSSYDWPRWNVPVWHERLKPAYAALRDVWAAW